MAELKKVGPVEVELVDDWRNWKNWWSLRWTTLAAAFSAMAGATVAHTPWWFPALCSGAAVLCNSASSAARMVAQKPKDDALPPQ